MRLLYSQWVIRISILSVSCFSCTQDGCELPKAYYGRWLSIGQDAEFLLSEDSVVFYHNSAWDCEVIQKSGYECIEGRIYPEKRPDCESISLEIVPAGKSILLKRYVEYGSPKQFVMQAYPYAREVQKISILAVPKTAEEDSIWVGIDSLGKVTVRGSEVAIETSHQVFDSLTAHIRMVHLDVHQRSNDHENIDDDPEYQYYIESSQGNHEYIFGYPQIPAELLDVTFALRNFLEDYRGRRSLRR